MNTPPTYRYKHRRFPAEIISHAVWLYFRFCLSYRDVEELLFARGIMVTYEAIRQWYRTCGQSSAKELRRQRPRPGDKWHLDEVFLTGSSGRIEAKKLLQRRAFKRNRLLGAFNEEVRDWLDFLVYTEFQDRDGKYQLTMFRRSAFAPLAHSMPPMLREEAFHLGTGHHGLKRVVKAGKIPSTLIQKYVNKWVPACYDLFGTDGSSSAHWAYTWGLKGRYNEGATREPADHEHLNEMARSLYVRELEELIADLNRTLPADQPKLRLPDLRFRRRIGDSARQPYAVDGTLLSPEAYERHLREVLPTSDDLKLMDALMKESDWIES